MPSLYQHNAVTIAAPSILLLCCLMNGLHSCVLMACQPALLSALPWSCKNRFQLVYATGKHERLPSLEQRTTAAHSLLSMLYNVAQDCLHPASALYEPVNK
jgi:hypothetical protein